MRNFHDSDFRKSSFSNHPVYTHCVEVAMHGTEVAVRDSKDSAKTTLRFTRDEWRAFINGVKDEQFEI